MKRSNLYTQGGKGPGKNRSVRAWLPVLCLALLVLAATGGCSVQKFAMKKVADALTASSGGRVFTGDNDPDLVGDALPFAIKMYESLLEAIPNHPGLQLKTGSVYIMYANAFLYTPATMLTESRYKDQEFLFKRAKNLYLRGRDILLKGLDKRHKGFLAALDKKQYDQAFKTMKKEDVPLLYWAGAGWLGAFAIDPFDMDLGISMPKAAALMDKVKQLDEGFGNGAIHEFYTLYYGSLPDYMGGDAAKARYHFQKALEISAGKSTSAYLALATTVCVKEQNVEEFKTLLGKALEVNPDLDLDNRLLHTLNQRRAHWLLEHIDDFFLLAEGEPESEEKPGNNLEGI